MLPSLGCGDPGLMEDVFWGKIDLARTCPWALALAWRPGKKAGPGSAAERAPIRKEVAVRHPGPPSPAPGTQSALNKCL